MLGAAAASACARRETLTTELPDLQASAELSLLAENLGFGLSEITGIGHGALKLEKLPLGNYSNRVAERYEVVAVVREAGEASRLAPDGSATGQISTIYGKDLILPPPITGYPKRILTLDADETQRVEAILRAYQLYFNAQRLPYDAECKRGGYNCNSIVGAYLKLLRQEHHITPNKDALFGIDSVPPIDARLFELTSPDKPLAHFMAMKTVVLHEWEKSRSRTTGRDYGPIPNTQDTSAQFIERLVENVAVLMPEFQKCLDRLQYPSLAPPQRGELSRAFFRDGMRVCLKPG